MKRYRGFAIYGFSKAEGWHVEWRSEWGDEVKACSGWSDLHPDMTAAMTAARKHVDAYWWMQAEEHWAELVDRGYVR